MRSAGPRREPAAVRPLFDLPADAVDAVDADVLAHRFNVAPRQYVPVVVAEDGTRAVRPMNWGLAPAWAKDPAEGPRPINARGETAATKPTFRTPFRRRRRLAPAAGFYEWQPDPGEPGGPKTPHLFRLAGESDDGGEGDDADDAGGLFAFAGLWDRRDADGGDPAPLRVRGLGAARCVATASAAMLHKSRRRGASVELGAACRSEREKCSG